MTRGLRFYRKVVSAIAVPAFALAVLASVRADDPPQDAKRTQEPPRQTDGPAPRGPGGNFDRLHSVVMELKLTDEQKTKIEEVFTSARKRAETPKPGEERGKASAKAYDDLRQGVEALLTDTQRKEFRTTMGKLNNDPGAANGGPVINLRETLQQVDLTDQQKDKIQDLVLEMKSKIGAAVKESKAGGDSAGRGKSIRDLSEEYKKKITDLLTVEQKAKLDAITKSQRKPGGKPEKPAKP